MLMFAWFWAATAAAIMPTPSQIMSLPGQILDVQHTLVAAASRPITAPIASTLMSLGWVDEDEAPIF